MAKFTMAQLQATGLELEVQGPTNSIRIPGAKRGRPEDEFKDEVLRLAQNHGWLRAHFRPAKTVKGWRTPVEGDGKGFLDLVLVRERVVWAELKADGNTLSDDQVKWFKALQGAKQEVYVWWPKDLSEIRKVLW
jgi:hypothetical protein